MNDVNDHYCTLCGGMTSEMVYVNPECSAVGARAVTVFQVKEGDRWKNVLLRICPRCGHIQGEIEVDNDYI